MAQKVLKQHWGYEKKALHLNYSNQNQPSVKAGFSNLCFLSR